MYIIAWLRLETFLKVKIRIRSNLKKNLNAREFPSSVTNVLKRFESKNYAISLKPFKNNFIWHHCTLKVEDKFLFTILFSNK